MDRDCINKRGLDLSKEVLWVSVGQRAAELQAVKVGGQKKFYQSARAGEVASNQADGQNFFLNSNFDSL